MISHDAQLQRLAGAEVAILRSLFAGMPRAQREASLVSVVSNAYMDESGEGLDTGHFLLAGYIAPEEVWTAFSTDWKAKLDEHGISHVHMVGLNRIKEPPFDRLSEAARDRALDAFVSVIKKHAPTPFMAHIRVSDWKTAVEGKLPPGRDSIWEHPYMIAAQSLVSQMLKLHEHLHRDLGVVVPIFDYHQKSRDELRRAILTELRPTLQRFYPHLLARFGEPIFPDVRNRHLYLPLQAADVLAWHQHRHLTHRDGVTRRVFRELVVKAENRPLIDINRRLLEGYVRACWGRD